MATNLDQIKKTIETKKDSKELEDLYGKVNTRETRQSQYQKELKNIFDNSKFDKQSFLSKLLENKTARVLFQMDQRRKWFYDKTIDGVAWEKSQTKQLAEKKFAELAKGEAGVEKKEKTEDYVKLDAKTKQALINLWLSSWKTLEQLWAKDKVILQTELSVTDKLWTIDRDVSIRLSLLNPKDIAAINKEIKENRDLSPKEAQDILNKKFGGRYILCPDCRPINKYIDNDNYEFIAWDHWDISKEELLSMPKWLMIYTEKKLIAFVNNAEKQNPYLKNANPILMWENNYSRLKSNDSIMEISVKNKANPKEAITPISKLDISSFVYVPELDHSYMW